MKNLILIPLFAVIFLVGAAVVPEEGGDTEFPRYLDNDIGLLTDDEAEALIERLDGISMKYEFDVVVAVTDELGGAGAREFAAELYEYFDFGMDSRHSGIILLIAVNERDYGYATTGRGLEIFTERGQDYLVSLFTPYLGEDDYYGAFMAFADAVEDFIIQYSAGTPYDVGNVPMSEEDRNNNIIGSVLISFLIAFAIAYIVIGIFIKQLKSVQPVNFAREYIRPGSKAVTGQSDRFLYRTVIKIKKSESGGSGGSGFSSSSGRSYSGRSGKY
jgi:uncharacterized protein